MREFREETTGAASVRLVYEVEAKEDTVGASYMACNLFNR